MDENLVQFALDNGIEVAEHFRVTEEFMSFRAGMKDFQLYLSNRREAVLQL